MPPRPLFIFSLPRSGSTLVQRVLGAHPEIATTSEPWLLLPHLYSLREEGIRAEYWHVTAAQAIGDFTAALPGGQDDYRAALHDFAARLYERAAGEATYFLDKTPRYHLIAREVIDLFPEGRFLFLWRNPLGVLASLMETFRDGRWEPYHFRVDLFDGVTNLVEARRHAGERAHSVRFEDLISDQKVWEEVFSYLDLSFDPELLSRFGAVRLAGRYGDPTGTRRYSGVSDEPLAKWRSTIDARVRVAWCTHYLRSLGADRLTAMGYELDGLLGELPPGRIHPIHAARDLAGLATSGLQSGRRQRTLRVAEGPQPIGPAFRGRRSLPLRAVGRLTRMAARRPGSG